MLEGGSEQASGEGRWLGPLAGEPEVPELLAMVISRGEWREDVKYEEV